MAMNDEEYEAELSEDDEDYRPDKEVDSVSENSASEADDPANSDDEGKTKKTKRRKKPTRGRNAKPVESDHEEEKPTSSLDPEEKKRRDDAIWASFLGSTEIPPVPKKEETNAKSATATSAASTSKASTATNIPKPKPKEIFEFAGETLDLPSKSNGDENPEETKANEPSKPPVAGIKRASTGGGLSSLLGQITKKNKLSVLEKTKLDWDGFKSKEGIKEELQTHNRGRDGFLERRDFLERTDVRQFEIEKNLRMTRRK